MIVRISASGGSFLGAGKYYLHDKLNEDRAQAVQSGERLAMRDQSDDRVWFSETRNTLNSDPERALEEMWRTAEDQAYLKMQAGVKRGGRVCEDPVKTISLSWHKDDRPEPQHMIDSADTFLKHMGWDNHQAVYVGHNDTEHRHIHIILNRVDHETGRTLDDYRERKRAQVWALAYEKDHDNVRCEERELRAAKREHRAPDLNDSKGHVPESQDTPTPQPTRTPANDHLPHNVVMLSRPLEQEFNAEEQRRAALDEQDRTALKAHQRAEREAHFKDGSKLFKAARHAAYDDVRQEFKAEWREFYKDAKVAGFGTDAAKDKAVSDAIYLAYAGQWLEAREQFGGREDQAKDVAAQFAERKADIEARQKATIAERQRDVCDALHAVREVQYQELLQRQRNERAAWTAGTSLEALGLASSEPRPQGMDVVANQNQMVVPLPAPTLHPTPEQHQAATDSPTRIEQGQTAFMQDMIAAMDTAVLIEKGGAVHPPEISIDATPAVTHQLTDLAAGSIGKVADYLADQLGELFAPTPPEVREAQAKADAKREADKPAPEDKSNAYARQIEGAVRLIEQERREGDGRAYWEDRDRGKGWERDQ
ncbi:MAG: relaxase/mobilization nuclease domain-containing protein [Hyphomicrobiaceae bacterium]